ncbi:MAG: chemotaxis response regulator protein-glutamate methylesterase [Desulfobulbaceae bacterium]|nr:chemotaxis response regulator protein-glutamate methylesterase [Desulfobulbaceae bacterium]
MGRKIKVLIIDDSAVVRKALSEVFQSDPVFEIMNPASDPFVAADRIEKECPDVITLDVEMPRMDGLTFLKKLMSQHPIPVVMCSSLTEKGEETTIRALEYGAVDIITKPKMGARQFIEESRIRICDSVKAAARVTVKKRTFTKSSYNPRKKLTADAVIPPAKKAAMVKTTERVISIGASTGGTEALKNVLMNLPRDVPGIVVVQHMPEGFTKAFAKRLDGLCQIRVKEAENGDTVLRGQALIAPGNRHTLLQRSGARYFVEVKDGPLVCRHRPSVDVLFRSTARYAGKNATGIIMTGMGDDGAKGLLEMKQAGAKTFAQDEKSCVVFGMPQVAIKLGAVDEIVPLSDLAAKITSCRS